MKNLLNIKNLTIIVACVLFNFAGSVTTSAATINVNSINALQTACNNSASGDIIVLANGTYTNVTLDINNNNISVIAQTPGGVFLNSYGDININGNNITFSGFIFSKARLPYLASFLLVTSLRHLRLKEIYNKMWV